MVDSICPYCAVGCGQKVYVRDDQVVQVEGNPDSPISRGRLCPKGSATKQLVTGPNRLDKVRYRRPHGTEWEDLDLDVAMDMIADRVIASRRERWEDTDPDTGAPLRRAMGFASLGGATLDNEENYLIKKLWTPWAPSRSRTRPAYDTARRSPVWGPRSGVAAQPPSSRISPTLT